MGAFVEGVLGDAVLVAHSLLFQLPLGNLLDFTLEGIALLQEGIQLLHDLLVRL